jgi:hypothetical protein
MDTRAPPTKHFKQFIQSFKAETAWGHHLKNGSLFAELYEADVGAK